MVRKTKSVIIFTYLVLPILLSNPSTFPILFERLVTKLTGKHLNEK